MTDQLTADCIHALKLALEAILAAGLLTLVWFTAPYFRNGGPRR